MKYRAISEGEFEGKRQQAFGDCHNKLREWAVRVAEQTNSAVHIYKLNEELAETVVAPVAVTVQKAG